MGTSAPDELRALSRLAFEELGRAPAGIGQVHRAIAKRAFGAVGPGALPSQTMHDAIGRSVYAALRGSADVAGRAADGVLARRTVTDGRALSTTPRGAAVLAALNGLYGDLLEREDSDLQEPMAVRVEGRAVPPEALADAFPDATPRLAVFVHGLFETEFAWRYGGGPTYGERLARDAGFTPVDVRYNSGRHISDNGRSLADLLAQVVEGWPVEVEQIALVGHSMGGLVARSACHLAAERSDAWVRHVRHVVSLGSPHRGAPLEEAVQLAGAALAVAPESRPFAGFLRRRSAGIRDLRRGSLVEEDWRDRDPDALRAAACRELALLEGATHCFVAATITESARHPVARMIGDWLVLESSATYRAQETLHVGRAHHLALLNHPRVYERLLEWLAPVPQPGR
jgi:pimeloyl-ACP methyl ester carboxylesterase